VFLTYFTSDGIKLIRRTEKKPTWEAGIKLIGAGKGDKIITLPEGKDPVVEGARIEFQRGCVVEWYENRPEGLEQGFKVKEKIGGEGSLSLLLRISGDIKPVLSEDSQVVDFLTLTNARVLRYGDLKTFDAEGKRLKNHFELANNTIKIVIDDNGAAYPISIDPFLTSPPWTAESNQVSALFGYSVSSAGDVNGDGYSDVIIGAIDYDNGQSGEGMAFVYYGSSTGLDLSGTRSSGNPTNADWTAESNQATAHFGCSVS